MYFHANYFRGWVVNLKMGAISTWAKPRAENYFYIFLIFENKLPRIGNQTEEESVHSQNMPLKKCCLRKQPNVVLHVFWKGNPTAVLWVKANGGFNYSFLTLARKRQQFPFLVRLWAQWDERWKRARRRLHWYKMHTKYPRRILHSWQKQSLF